MSDIKDRMAAWISSSNCWCDKSGQPYCSVCEIMIDAVERIEYLESLLDKKVEQVISNVTVGAGPVENVGH